MRPTSSRLSKVRFEQPKKSAASSSVMGLSSSPDGAPAGLAVGVGVFALLPRLGGVRKSGSSRLLTASPFQHPHSGGFLFQRVLSFRPAVVGPPTVRASMYASTASGR